MIAAAAPLLFSCSQYDGTCTLSETFPLTFSAQTDASSTRATSDNTWDETETVRVNVNGTVYPFSVSTSGVLTNASLYWSDYTSIDAFAWYPEGYSFTADQSTGVQAADFIFAEKTEGITDANFNTDHKLTFKHKTAKVTASLTAGYGIADISGATLKFYGYTEVDAIDSTGTTPTGAISGKTPGWITPDAANTALLLPKNYSTEKVLKVSLAGKDYFWKPASLNLEAGKSYSFTITVEHNTLSVTVTNNGATWAGTASEVTAAKTISGIPAAFIPKGTFIMGSPSDEPNRMSNETQHQVTLTQNFYMSIYEITNAQYAAFLNDNYIGENGEWESGLYPSERLIMASGDRGVHWDDNKWVPASGYDNHPVINVTWFGADEYARWAGGCLPTEAQWEYACRAGTTTTFYFGDNYSDMDAYGWTSENSSNEAKAVGLKQPNAFGLYDMHGNVFEWCMDGYGIYGSDPVTDPIISSPIPHHVVRGGYYKGNAMYCRSAFRAYYVSYYIADTIGFRVVWVQ
jgi:formylglycine-generating enzyme required for sulfatase activity